MKCSKCGQVIFTWITPPMKCNCDKKEVKKDDNQRSYGLTKGYKRKA